MVGVELSGMSVAFTVCCCLADLRELLLLTGGHFDGCRLDALDFDASGVLTDE